MCCYIIIIIIVLQLNKVKFCCDVAEWSDEPVEEALVCDQQQHVHVLQEQARQLEEWMALQKDWWWQGNSTRNNSEENMAKTVISPKNNRMQIFFIRKSN